MSADGRRLAAILFTDMVGYSALTQRDENLALRLVEETGRLARDAFASHRGRIVKTMGDGLLVEFDTALEATEGAIALQRTLFERNQKADGHRIEMRVGIHLGDVAHDGGDVFGDAVNIAARIEPLAEASGICISGAVFDQVRTKLPYSATRLEHAFLKNIETPIAVYSLDLPWHAPPAARITPWTDRVSELASLRQAVDAAVQGAGGTVAIVGEPGIGKTRLAGELIRHAELLRFRVLRGRGFEGARQVPYALWAEAIRSFLLDAPAPLLYKISDQCAAELLELLPEIRPRLGSVPPLPEVDAESARLRFLSGITRFFRNLSKESPLLLLLDDLQWADSGSLALLDYLGRRIPQERVLVVVTYRDVEVEEGGALHKVLFDLRRERFLREVPLKQFDPETSRQFVDAILATDRLPDDLVPLVVDRGAGNPYFVEELMRSLVEEGVLLRTASGWERAPKARVELPSTVREIIRRRVDRVGRDAAEVLSVASVLGGEFDFELLRRVSGLDAPTLLGRVEALLRARLLQEREVSPGVSVLRFADEQIREVIYDQMSLVRRRIYHKTAAEAIEAIDPAAGDRRASELARHYLDGGDLARAREFTLRAAARSAALHSNEEAYRLYRRALDLLGAGEDEDLRTTTLLALGDAALASFHTREAVSAWTDASRALLAQGRRREAAALYSRLSGTFDDWLADSESARTYALEGIRLLEAEGESPELAAAYLDIGAVMAQSLGDLDRGRESLERAIEFGRKFGDVDSEATAVQFLALTMPLREKDRSLDLIRDGIRIVRDGKGARVATKLSNFAETLSWVKGDTAAAERYLKDATEEGLRTGVPVSVMAARALLAYHVHFPRGEWEDAVRVARRVIDSGVLGTAQLTATATLVLIELYRGRLDAAAELLARVPEPARATDRIDQVEFLSLLRARAALERGDLEAAEGSIDRGYRTSTLTELTVTSVRPLALALSLRVELGLRRGRVESAETGVRELGAVVAENRESWTDALFARAEGLVWEARGEWARAVSRLEASASAFGALGWPFERALSLYGCGVALQEAGREDEAIGRLDEAIAIFTRVDARPYAERARARRVDRPRAPQART